VLLQVNEQMIGRRINERNYEIGLPPQLRGRWVVFALTLPPAQGSRIVALSLLSQMAILIGREMLLRRLSFGRAQCWAGVFYVPDDAETIQLDLVDTVLATSEIAILLRPISRPTAALLIALRHPFKLLRASLGNLSGQHGRIREALSSIAVGTAPTSYRDWIALFDNWQPHDHARLLESPRRAAWPSIGVCVFAGATDTGRQSTTSQRHADLLRATEKSLLNQSLPCPYRIAGQAGNTSKLESTLVHLDCEYVALLQAGEILPRQALALLADQAVSLGRPLVICADDDELTRNGVRCNPLFKPAPNHALMLSGTLSRGIWLVRRDVLLDHAGDDVRWAEILRLDIWLRLYEHGMADSTRRVPHILTHRLVDAEAAPAGELAASVAGHLARMAIPAHVQPAWPLRVDIIAPQELQPEVTIVVPSVCREQHVIECLGAVLARTRYERFNLVVVISQTTALDDRQLETVARLSEDPRFRYMLFKQGSFNYSLANNAAVAATEAPLVCLLNDDVEPKDPDWLARMVGHLCDPRVGAVGAKLDYPNGLVQHGGVILGSPGFCQHANRHLPGNQPGYAWRAVLDQELSAVTGACLLVRRSLYDRVRGMDETYASSYNDIDFCLKIREAGYAVVFCATTELIHFESLSYGSHYCGDTAADRHAKDVKRMQNRWSSIGAADPFHNPNLSLLPGREWALAFPPRVSKPPRDPSPRHPAARSSVVHDVQAVALQG
jgi:O-antigen biosynthesis protein